MVIVPHVHHRLSIPEPPPAMLPRDPLVARILGTPASGLCLLTAPAGYGCTTIMAAAARRCDGAVAWVSAEAKDAAAPLRFWGRLAQALRLAGADTSGLASLLERQAVPRGPAGDGALEAVIAEVLNTVFRMGPLTVFIDDLDSRLHTELAEGVLEFVEGQPAGCRSIVRARHGTRMGLAHLLSSGRLVRLDTRDLELGSHEAHLLAASLAPTLQPVQRASLVEAAGGWLAALTAGARVTGCARDEPPVTWLLGTGLDLLLAAELEQLSDEERQFLVQTCVLDTLAAEACDALRGSNDSHLLLARLEAAGTLITRRPGRASSYRLHPLLGEHLRRQLDLSTPGALSAAHRAAAHWLLAQGDAEGAITHFLESGDVVAALKALEQHLQPLLDAGRAQVVRRWYGSTPPPALGDHHLHLLGAVWAELISGHVDDAERRLARLDDALADLDPARRPSVLAEGSAWLAAEVALVRAQLDSWHGYPARATRHVDQARDYWGEEWLRAAQQTAAFQAARLRLWTGRLTEAKELLVSAAGRPRTQERFRRVTLPSLKAYAAAVEGRAHRAQFLASDALETIDRRGRFWSFDDCDARLALAISAVDLDQLDRAEHHARTALDRAIESRHLSYQVLAQLRLATIEGAHRRGVRAREVLADVRRVLRASAPGSDLVTAVDVIEARLCLDLGLTDAARLLSRRLPAGAARELHEARLATLVDTRSGLRRAHRIRPESVRETVELRVLLALCHSRTRPAEAMAHLRAAGESAYELGQHRLLVGWPDEIQVLAERLARDEGSAALARLLWVARVPAPESEPDIRLTSGELELLLAIPGTDGNAELAVALGVSVNTIKTRLRRLYRKLEVHDREGALRRGQALGVVAGRSSVTPAVTRRVT